MNRKFYIIKIFFKLAEKYPQFYYLPTLSQPGNWSGEIGYIQDKFKEKISKPENWDIYACGRKEMIQGLTETIKSMGFNKNQLHYDKWG